MKRVLSLTVAGLLVLSSVTLAQPSRGGRGQPDQPAWHHPERPGPQHGPQVRAGMPGVKMILAMADDINLTDEQKAKLEQMVVTFNLEKVDQRAKAEKAKIKLRALMRDENAKEIEVNAAIDALAGLKAELQKMHYRHHKEVRSLLTEVQIDKLKQLRQEKRQQMKGQRSGKVQGSPRGPGYRFDFDPDSDI